APATTILSVASWHRGGLLSRRLRGTRWLPREARIRRPSAVVRKAGAQGLSVAGVDEGESREAERGRRLRQGGEEPHAPAVVCARCVLEERLDVDGEDGGGRGVEGGSRRARDRVQRLPREISEG